jgi:hypothetical protein
MTELTTQDIESLVRGLESLRGGAIAASALVRCGARAIAPLRSSLLENRPRGIYQPRQLVVETLGELGAKEVLIEYLERPPAIEEPVIRLGEDVVRSAAAQELARWKTEDVFDCLTRAARLRLLPGIVEALGRFRRTETLPYLLEALGDGVCRSYAEDAIRALGVAARRFLVDAADFTRAPSRDRESPSSVQRRRWVLRILCDLKISDCDWSKLRDLLEDDDAETVITTCRIGLEVAPASERGRAVRRLIEILPRASWFLRIEAKEALEGHFDLARNAVENEIARRTVAAGAKDRAMDIVLRLLTNLRNESVGDRTR